MIFAIIIRVSVQISAEIDTRHHKTTIHV